MVVNRDRKGQAVEENCARAVDNFAHYSSEGGGEAACEEFLQRVTVPLHDLERNVDPILEQVHGHGLPEVGQLQGGPRGIAEALARAIARTPEIKYQASHRVCR